MASDLLLVAVRTLEHSEVSVAMKTVATEALLSAAQNGLPLPPRAPWLIWTLWTTNTSACSWRHVSVLGDIPDARVRAGAMAILEAKEVGEELRDLAVRVLVGVGHAAQVEDRLIMTMVERGHSVERAQEAVRLIEAVHAARGIAVEILRMVRDRWAATPTAAVREAAIAVTGQVTEPDIGFIERMLADPDADVRAAMAFELERDLPGRELALGVVEARLRVEVHPRVRAALLRAQAALLDDMHDDGLRRRRRR
ncbi:MAG: hypothetical protein KF850_01835 [Labilithrix sp.]|nr:hypothetical protein [Labilithrix sp.]